MPKLDFRNIERDPKRCGGQPAVSGTRIRVATVLACYRQGMTVEEIVQQYQHLRPSDVHDALAYAYDHLMEIEADLAADGTPTTPHRADSFICGGSAAHRRCGTRNDVADDATSRRPAHGLAVIPNGHFDSHSGYLRADYSR